MAYMTEIGKPKCARCSKRATHYVYNRFNANNGAYCTPHARAYVAELKSRDA